MATASQGRGCRHPQFLHPDGQALATAVAERAGQLLRQAIAIRGAATLAVSGGRSPVPLFQALSGQILPWDKVTVALVDERWVSPDSTDSNERLVRDNLLVGRAAAAQLFALKTDDQTPAAAVRERTAALRALPLPFDLVILGMGEDGHTASLFPGAAGLADALDASRSDLLVAMVPPSAAHARMSLSLRGLLSARQLILPLSGQVKRAVLARAAVSASPLDLPVAALLQQDAVPVELHLSP